MNTAIYVRVSTDEQAREGYSIRAQEEKLRAYATLKDWSIYNIYADEGISGKDINGRPAIKQLIADVASGKVKNVLVYKIDRLTRSTKNLIELVELFNANRCAFNSLQESIDTSSATGRMFLKIVGIFAEFERENLAERVRLGLERKAKEGFSLSNYIPAYGYTKINGNRILEINKTEAATVRRIFDMYLHENINYSQITKILNSENIHTKRASKWTMTTISGMLSNPTYIGKVRYAVRDSSRYFEVDGHHEAIIDETTYYKTQEKIKRTGRISLTKHPTSSVYFCGVLYCSICGYKFTTKWNYRKDEHAEDGRKSAANPSYYCSGIKPKGCTAGAISHKKVERVFEQYISNIQDLAFLGSMDEENPQPYIATAPTAAIAAEIKEIEEKTEEVMRLFISNTIDLTTYQGMVKLSNKRRSELEARQVLTQSAQKKKEAIFTPSGIKANFRKNWTTLDNDQRQQFIQRYVKKIILHSDKSKGAYHSVITINEIVFNEY
ncbi:MAG: recombinase family protein [Defluviitaleaceae bacterium]|nr:recombinase family protein [Defluviitaleaceae bacterium]